MADRPAEAADVGYAAFISYSHARDRELGQALESALERFPAPWYQRSRPRQVYLDDGDLPATPNLPASLQAALRQSGHLIVIASPEAQDSRWMDKEVGWWLDHHDQSTDKIMIVRAAGTVTFRPTGGVAYTDALPPRLAAALTGEPRVLDVPFAPGTRRPDLRSRRWSELLADIVATLDDVPKDTLIGQHIHNERRWKRIRLAALATVCVLLMAIAGAGYVALEQGSNADTQQRIATARLLLAKAQSTLVSDPQTALRLAEAAAYLDPGPEIGAGVARLVRGTAYAGTLAGQGGHGNVTSVVFTRDGSALAVARSDGTTSLWDTTDLARPHQIGPAFVAQAAAVGGLAFSPSGAVLATADNGGGVVLWDVRDKLAPRPWGNQLENGQRVVATAFTADGARLLCGLADGTVRTWDVHDPARPQPGPTLGASTHRLQAMALSADGGVLATGDATGAVTTWSMTDPLRPIPLGPTLSMGAEVDSLALSPDGHVLVAGGADAVVMVWDVAGRTAVRLGEPVADGTAAVHGVAVSADGHTVTATSQNGVTSIWDVPSSARISQFEQPDVKGSTFVLALAAHPSGVVAVGGLNGDVVLWAAQQHPQPQPLGPPLVDPADTFVDTAAYTADGRHLLAASDATLHLWDVTVAGHPAEGDAVSGDAPSTFGALALSADRRVLAAAGTHVTINTLDDAGHATVVGQTPRNPSGTIRAIALRPDGKLMATGNVNGTVLLWDLTVPGSPRQVGSPLAGFPDRVNTLVFSRDGKTLVAGSEARGYRGPAGPPPGAQKDGVITLWDVTAPDAARMLGGPLTGSTGSVRAATVSPDGRTLAYGGTDGDVHLWDIGNPAEPHQIGGPLAAGANAVAALTFTPDSATLAGAGIDGYVQLWDVADLTQPVAPIGRLAVRPGFVRTLDVAPDGSTLAAAGAGTVRQWDLRGLVDSRHSAFVRACAVSGGGLDRAQWKDNVPGMNYADTCPSDPPPALPSTDVSRFGEAAAALGAGDPTAARGLLVGTFDPATSVAEGAVSGAAPVHLRARVHELPAHAVRKAPGVDAVDKQTGAVFDKPWIAVRNPVTDPRPAPDAAVSSGTTVDGVTYLSQFDRPGGEDVVVSFDIDPATLTGRQQRTIDVYAVATLKIAATTSKAAVLHYAGTWTVGTGPDGRAALLETAPPATAAHAVPDVFISVPR